MSDKGKRNLKLFNHWLAQVRDIAHGQVVNEEGRVMGMSDVKWVFSKELMEDYFKDGLKPQQAFDEEVSNWDEGYKHQQNP